MSWLARRTATVPSSDELTLVPFAAEFANAVDRSFPVDDAAIQRIRGRVLGAFIETAPTPATARLSRPIARGLAMAVVATVGLFAFSGVAVQAQPGGPFYPLRMAIETATLPSIDAPSGWDARLGRLSLRIDESLAAQRGGDPGALTAALAEYRSELAGLSRGLDVQGRRSSLVAAVSGDLAIVVGLSRTDPVAGLLVADMRVVIGSTDPNDGNAGPRHQQTNQALDADTGNPHPDGATGNPHQDGATGNPHSDGATGNPHSGGSTGDPHSGGSTGNPHSGGCDGEPAQRLDRQPAQRLDRQPAHGRRRIAEGLAGARARLIAADPRPRRAHPWRRIPGSGERPRRGSPGSSRS